jgi:hypothetical protein
VREIRQPDRLDRHIGAVGDLGIDRHEEVVALILDGAARQVHECLHIGTRGVGAGKEIAQGGLDRLFVQVASADDIEAGRLQHLRDESGIVGGRRQGLVGIALFADDQRDARVLGRRSAWRNGVLRGGQDRYGQQRARRQDRTPQRQVFQERSPESPGDPTGNRMTRDCDRTTAKARCGLIFMCYFLVIA